MNKNTYTMVIRKLLDVVRKVAIDLGLIAVSFLFAIFQARKIRKIEAYTMLTEC